MPWVWSVRPCTTVLARQVCNWPKLSVQPVHLLCCGLRSICIGKHNMLCCCCLLLHYMQSSIVAAYQPISVPCWDRSHVVKRRSAVVQKQPLVVCHSSLENLPADLLAPSFKLLMMLPLLAVHPFTLSPQSPPQQLCDQLYCSCKLLPNAQTSLLPKLLLIVRASQCLQLASLEQHGLMMSSQMCCLAQHKHGSHLLLSRLTA